MDSFKVFFENNAHLFWDTDPATLDLDTHKRYIIPRVMDYGKWETVQEIIHHYGINAVLDVLKNAPSLDKKTISYFALRYDIPIEDFRAYQRRKLSPYWN